MSTAIKNKLDTIALKVATASKSYTDTKIKELEDNLQWQLGTYDLGVETDNTVAYTKSVPSGVIKGKLGYIGGASKVSENLIVLQDVVETTTNGITYSVSNGVVSLSGTSTAGINLYLEINEFSLNGTYYYAEFPSGTYGTYSKALRYGTTNVQNLSNNNSFTNNDGNVNRILFYIPSGQTFTNYTIKPMLVKGTTAPTEFSVGFDGIRSAKVTRVKFEGANVLNPSYLGDSISFSNDICSITNSTVGLYILKEMTLSKGTYVFSFINLTALNSAHTFTLYKDDGSEGLFVNIDRFTLGTIYTKTITLDKETTIYVRQWQNAIESYSFKLWINRDTSKDYTPYVEPITKAIPQEVLALDLCKSAGSVYDLIDLVNKKGVQKVNSITLNGTETWTLMWNQVDSGYYSYRCEISDIKVLSGETPNLICDKFDTYSTDNLFNANASGITQRKNNPEIIVKIGNTSLSTAELFKTWLSSNPITLLYELATPIETDISQYIDDDFKNIDTTDMTTITFENEFEYDVPSEIDYLIEEVKA